MIAGNKSFYTAQGLQHNKHASYELALAKVVDINQIVLFALWPCSMFKTEEYEFSM